jgi:hypothetical protein
MAANSEALYRDGVTLWAARDLDAATDRIAAAIAASWRIEPLAPPL